MDAMEGSVSGGSIAGDSEDYFEYDEHNASMNDADDTQDDDDAMIIERPVVRKSPYVVMPRDSVGEQLRRCVQDASELLDVTREEAYLMLRVFGWDLTRLQDAWFDSENKTRLKCGLTYSASSRGASSSKSSGGGSSCATCPICMCDGVLLVELNCGHGFCSECWKGYLHGQVDDGKAAPQARCPQHKCSQVVPADFFMKFCDEDRIKKFEEWFMRSYVDDNPNVKWCPSPSGCINAVEYQGVENMDIRCTCGWFFCWQCGEEAHQPAACATVQEWLIKNSAESENIGWIMANTKKCPKCARPIEKNQGCNHMACSKAGGCGSEFCWLCLGDWASHGSSTGGYYQCNIYEKQVKDGKHSVEDKAREKAKDALNKYIFYFERFMDHDRGMRMTVSPQEGDVENKVQQLHDKHGFEIIELQFLYEALRQVRACRRVLKWSYVYGYYLDEGGPEKNLFEHLQKNLEEKTDNLHEMLEKDFENIFFSQEAEGSIEGKDANSTGAKIAIPREEKIAKFMEFRMHVTNFTNVTQKFLTQILLDLGHGKSLTKQTKVDI